MNVLKNGSRGEDVKMLQSALHLLPDGIFGKMTEESVKEFQKANGLKADGIVGTATWAKINAAGGNLSVKKSKRNIKEIIIHCSATPEGRDYTVADIRKWHKQRGFSDIGYHYIIYRDGTVHDGRDVNISGAHCTNHNSISVGICYIGGLAADGKTAKDTRTEPQKKALLNLLQYLKRLYPKATVHGHNEFACKACPSFNVQKEYKSIN